MLSLICIRLGEAEKAMYHYKHSGPEADPEDIAKAKRVQSHLSKCTEARKLRDWNTLIKESRCAISAGADSAPQVSHRASPISISAHARIEQFLYLFFKVDV